MVDKKIVMRQLDKLGANSSFWGKAELAELPKVMIGGEVIEHVRHGYYSGGFATLVATNHRLLLIDKKMFFLTVEDIRYDMIAEVDYGQQVLAATIHVRSFSKDLKFQSLDKRSLRSITHFIQHKIMELRGHQTAQSVNPQTLARQPIPMQVFGDPSQMNDQITDQQLGSVLPLDQESWYKINPTRKVANPYAQSPLVTRRRVGRFSYANDR